MISSDHGENKSEEGIFGMLREAAKIAGIGLKRSPRKKQKTSAGSSSLVRNVSDDEDNDGPELTTDKSDTDLGLLDPSGDSEGYLVQAASGAIEL